MIPPLNGGSPFAWFFTIKHGFFTVNFPTNPMTPRPKIPTPRGPSLRAGRLHRRLGAQGGLRRLAAQHPQPRAAHVRVDLVRDVARVVG